MAPVIGGIKMKKLGKGKPGRMKSLVTRHLGKAAGDKITKSDGARLVAKGKKTGNKDLVRKGSFIRNMMREGKGLYHNIHMKRKRGEKMRKAGAKGAPKPRDFDRAATTAKEDRTMKSFKEHISEKKLTPAELKKREEIAQAIKRDNPKMPMDKKMAIATATAKRVAESPGAWKKWAKTPAGKRYAALSPAEKEAKAKSNRMNEETEIGGKTFDDLELCKLAVKAFEKDYKEADNKQAVLDAAQAVDNYLAIERKGLKGKITDDDLTKMKELVQVAKKKIADAGLSASDHDYHQGHIETVQDLLKKQKIDEALALRPLRAKGQTKDESMYKSPAHARLQKFMNKNRQTAAYKNQVRKLGGTPLKPGEQNPMKRTEAVEIPDKDEKKLAKIVKGLKKSVKGHDKQQQYLQKLLDKDAANEEACCDDCKYDHVISEAMHQGKTVKLNDPIRTSEVPSKKFKVYVKDGDKIKVVRFGDPGLSIKRDSPERRKSFRARHNCDNPGPKTKARYWSCFQWRSGSKVDN